MIVLLNGPPRCGKDTFAKIAQHHLPHSMTAKLSKPMKDCFRSVFHYAPSSTIGTLLEEHKDLPLFRGQVGTPRSFQIKLYELLAQQFGSDILGVLAMESLKRIPAAHVFVTDSGRDEEVQHIIDYFKYANVGIVKIRRPGTTFEGDCRGWLSDDLSVKYKAEIKNQYDMLLYEAQIRRVLANWGLIDEIS